MIVREQVPLAPLTTLGVGGPARYFVEAGSDLEVSEAVLLAKSSGLPLFVLGGGSNVLVADHGFDGLVLKIGMTGVQQGDPWEGKVIFEVAAGEDWDAFVERTVAANCAGLECLSGIPGTVGGTPVQNVGAYGQEVSETIPWVRAVESATGRTHTFSNEQCQFGYRSSRFNSADRGKFVVVEVRYELQLGGRPTLRYPELQKHFSGRSNEPSLAEVRQAVLQIRCSKSMVLVAGDENSRSAGSFFKNPVVTQQEFEQLTARMQSRGAAMPSYPVGEALRKLSAAWLIEHAGFSKGYARGAVGISTRHALAIVNRGGATAAEIVALAQEIRSRVSAKFGIELVLEPVMVGF
ncbi:MAG TPA: UDP-N-acetylmuramate dehydrogenase [Candidatus Eisenbacteria bacterium]|nr:UDP-N-acetylmuramate dehydrogenase [Candidatus Eisenbacteria bacterium]